jgi:hypothetical protein
MSAIQDAIQSLRERRYDDAARLAVEGLRQAAAKSPDRLTEAARTVVAWKGFFENTRDAAASEPYFRAVFAVLEELAGPASPAAMAAAGNLAGMLGSLGQLDEAIALGERVLAHVRQRFPADDVRFLSQREALVFLYRLAGNEAAAMELYRETGLCEHLRPAERHLRELGAKLYSVGRPWTENCHIWVFFDTVLDCEGLIARLGLDSCVSIHDHRGTHDGSERGLVCSIHQDGIMGRYPLDANPQPEALPGPPANC